MNVQWNKPNQIALLTWLIGLILTGTLTWWMHASNQRLYEERLSKLTDELAQLVERNFGLYEYGLRGARGAVVAAGGAAVTRPIFAAYMETRDLTREFPGARGFGFIRKVARADEARFVAQARADGAADFSIRELAAHGGERFVIQYIHPIENNLSAMGLDVASETNRREAALASAQEGKVRLTAPITLVQADAKARRGFLAFLPVYRTGAAVHTPEARAAAVLGWTYAPLLVDDVLTELGPRLQELGVRLTDSAEQSPFFDSMQGTEIPSLSGVTEVSREIGIFGRRWLLQTNALQPLAAAARPLPVVFTGVVAAVGSSLLALLVLSALRSRQRYDAASLPVLAATGGVTVSRFLVSPLARWAGVVFVVLLAVYVVLDYRALWLQQMESARRTLSDFVDNRAARLNAAQSARRKTMLFLAAVPPVNGLILSAATGIDPQDGSSRQSWQLRMQQILRAHLIASPEVYQARFIGVANGGRELVRVERRKESVVVIPEAELQAKGDRAYMRQTLRLQAGEVWMSDLDLNQESGKLEVPHRPTIRYATPVYQSNGAVFGIIIVNVDVADRQTESVAATPSGAVLHITNGQSDFLLHPDPARQFGFDLGQRHRWEDEFKAAELPRALNNDRLQAWVGPQGLVVAASAQGSPNAGSSVGVINYTASMPMAALEAAVWSGLVRNLRFPLAASAFAWLFLFLYWSGVQRQLQVREQRLRLAAIVDQSMDAIIGVSAIGRVTSWNRGAVQLFGIDEATAVGQPLQELIDAPSGVLLPIDVEGYAQRERSSEFECRGRAGHRLRVMLSLSRLDGVSASELSAIVRDVTAERAAQQQTIDLNHRLEGEVLERTASLAAERQRLSNILSSTRVGTWEWNVATGATVFNERWADIFGYRLDELMPITIETWASYVHPEDLSKSGELLERHFEGSDEHYSIEVRMRHKSGRWVWVLSRGKLVTRTPEGAPEWMYGTHQEITAIKEAELEVKHVASLLSSVLSASTEFSIIATDAQGLITLFNVGSEQMLGYQALEMVGISSPAPLHLPAEVVARGNELSAEYGVEIAGFRVFVHKAELDGAERREWTYVRKDGFFVRVSLVVTAIRDVAGGVVGYLGIAQDITERLRAESALRHAKAEAESASAAKSMFLANMSHEIRTPMNAVIGMSYLLESTSLNADQRQLLSKLQNAGRSLLGIINDVLDLSKIEAGELGVEAAPMNPVELLRELEQMFSTQTQAKGLGLEIHGLHVLPPRLMVDELRLRQILVNLTSNAIKFTAQGRVSIEVQREFDEQQQPWLRWRIRDTGVGIQPEAIAKLFAPFVQADASTTRQFGGTGLGLSIVRKLAGLMGGEVGVSSEPGRGSEFWLRLPLIEATESQADSTPADGAGLNVVVVDDNPDDRRILAGMCRLLGWRALELASGADLVAHCQRALDGVQVSPDALLVDWQMPGLDGLQALEQVATRVGKQRLPAVLIISAHERSAIAALDHKQLVNHVLTKPVGPSELFNAVNHCVSLHTGSTDRVALSTRIEAIDSQWLVGVQLLVVDDNDINLEVARRLLERDGAIVLTASNGLEALDLLRREPRRFDAVLMDVQMPVMDGYEATRRIRSELGLGNLPVLALTAGALGEERRQAEAAGMNDFLTKPLDPKSMVRALRRAVEAARGQPLQLTPGEQALDLPVDWPEIEGIDGRDAALRVGEDAELFLRMLGRLLDELESTHFAVTAPDDTSVDRQALTARLHKLRGSAGLLGARDVHRLTGEAENALRAGASIHDVQPSLVALDHALQQLDHAARPVIAAVQQDDTPSNVGGLDVPALAKSELAQLVLLLHQQDMSAGQLFKELAPALAASWGSAYFAQVRHAVEGLDFSAALQLIDGAPDPASGNSAGG